MPIVASEVAFSSSVIIVAVTTLAGVITTLWTLMQRMVNRSTQKSDEVESRLMSKLDECEDKHDSSNATMLILTSRVSKMEGSHETLISVQEDLGDIPKTLGLIEQKLGTIETAIKEKRNA
jgi:hypothetical protein